MKTIIAPPSLFSAYAIANWGQLGTPLDPDLQPGTHLRVYAGTGPSFPVTPFLCFPLTSYETEDFVSLWTMRDGTPVTHPNPGKDGPLQVTLVGGEDGEWQKIVRYDLQVDNASWADVLLLDQRDRIIQRRTAEPWMFGAPLLQKLFVASDADYVSVTARIVEMERLLGMDPGQVLGMFGLPEKGRHPWYVGIHNRDDAISRVLDGAPQRITPMDVPNGPFWTATPDEEVDRVEQLLAAQFIGGGIESVVDRLVEDDSQPPWKQVEEEALPGTTPSAQSAVLGRLAALQMVATDPGVARFFGFSTRLDFEPDIEGGQGPDTIAIATMIAFDPAAIAGAIPELNDDPWTPASWAGSLRDIIVRTLAEQTGEDPRVFDDALRQVTDFAATHGVVVAPFLTLVAPTPPWQPPNVAEPLPFNVSWEHSDDASGSTTYRSSFAFQEPPLATLAAFAREINGDLRTLHEPLPNGRAKPKFFGSARPATAPGQTNPPVAGVLSDQEIPAIPAVVTYQVSISDCFGRFGSPVAFPSSEPPRPLPPRPTLRFSIRRDAVDSESTAKLSPGRLVVTIAVASSTDPPFDPDDLRLKSAIVVPRIDQLAAGARPLVSLLLDLAGDTMTIPLDTPGFLEREFTLPPLAPQARGSWTLSGTYTDSDLRDSETALALVEAVDPRPPKVILSGVGAYWTSAPGPSPDVEVRLRWPAPPKSKHRVYLTSADAIGIATASPNGLPHSRGLVAAEGCKRIQSGAAVEEDRFSILTAEPVEAGSDGVAVLLAKLPRTLESVQFLRIVPLGPDGAQAPFAACGIVPVAVPEFRSPLPPVLEPMVDELTGSLTLTIRTDSLNRSVLLRDEPGLVEPEKPGKSPPEFRVRRTASGLTDPIYARTAGTGTLTLKADDGTLLTFEGSWPPSTTPEQLKPFVRTTYWAEVRMPPERRLPAGWVEEEPVGGATTVDPAGAAPHPRPYSPLSAPCPVIWIPPDRPAAPATADITTERVVSASAVRLTLQLANPPVAHPLAIDRYRLAIWSQTGEEPIARVTQFVPDVADAEWPELTNEAIEFDLPLPAGGDPNAPITLRIGIVDPAGRLGSLTEVSI